MMLTRARALCAILCCGVGLCFAAEAPVSVAFVGDIMLAETPGREAARGHDPFAPFAALLAGSDLRVGNLECVVAGSGQAEPGKPFTFRAHPRTLRFLKKHFDALALANNHSGDYGPAAFAEMLERLESKGLGYFGGGRDLAAAHRPLILTRGRLRIALLGYDEFLPRSFEAEDDKPGVAWSEDEQVQRDIALARRDADLVIPVMHWGEEHAPLANARQRRLARLMIDAGADAVVGGHPHVTQDIEFYRGKPIIYSLGNFVFDGFHDADNNTGWLLRLELDHQGVRRGRTYIAHIDGRGIPHPAPGGSCWERGQDALQECAAE
jgi:poly-gamma-glutamate synthesis protein (capsule biosynthesis protein)